MNIAELQARVKELEAERDEYQQAADKLAAENKVMRDAIEASRKQEAVAVFVSDDEYSHVDLTVHQGGPLVNGQRLYAAPVVAPGVLKDAERYRWLRERSWWDTPSTVCVVADPKNAIKLGSFCPSSDLLDAAIDAAMGGAND